MSTNEHDMDTAEVINLPSGEVAAVGEAGGFYIGFGPMGQGHYISAADVRVLYSRLSPT